MHSQIPLQVRALAYPSARRGDQIDDYHGIQVADRYRWMEDVDSPETRAWVEAEAKLTSDYLGGADIYSFVLNSMGLAK